MRSNMKNYVAIKGKLEENTRNRVSKAVDRAYQTVNFNPIYSQKTKL